MRLLNFSKEPPVFMLNHSTRRVRSAKSKPKTQAQTVNSRTVNNAARVDGRKTPKQR